MCCDYHTILLFEQCQLYKDNKINMYNIHQYNSAVKIQEQQRNQQQRHAKYLLKHGDFKEEAIKKQKDRLAAFIREQIKAEKPLILQDDHHMAWRAIKPFRDVQDRTKFLDFKTFRHKPHNEMGKIFNERERKEILYLSQKKEPLVQLQIIPEEQRSRSLRSQGPLNPKITFRNIRKDNEYLQPRLRFSNITDSQRINQHSMSFDQKLTSLYKSFQMTKSKLGRASVSPTGRYDQKKDIFDGLIEASSEMDKSKSFYFQRDVSGTPIQPDQGHFSNVSSQVSLNASQTSSKAGLNKTYFKLAKMMQLFSQDTPQKQALQIVLKRSQYDRKKDMTNITSNVHGQSYIKSPIL